MSIYSGFATRNQEQFYDKVLYNLISTLLLRLSKFYKREPVDEPTFFKIIFDQERSLRKLQKRKYLQPKYSPLLTSFKANLQEEQGGGLRQNWTKQPKTKQMHEKHELNRTLSLLGKQLLSLKSNYYQQHSQNEEKEINSSLAKIEERKKHVSKRKKKQKKTSIKSNLDIWDMRQEKTPELPSLNPLQKTIMARTKFNNFSQKMASKEIEEPYNEDQVQSLKNILSKPPKFRAKMYFK